MTINWKAFGALIREDRERLKLKQTEYAVHVGLRKTQQGKLSLLETAKIKAPAYEVVQRLKAVLGLSVLPGETELTGEVAQPPTDPSARPVSSTVGRKLRRPKKKARAKVRSAHG